MYAEPNGIVSSLSTQDSGSTDTFRSPARANSIIPDEFEMVNDQKPFWNSSCSGPPQEVFGRRAL